MIVEGPDGATIEFPDGTPDPVVDKAMRDYYAKQNQPPQDTRERVPVGGIEGLIAPGLTRPKTLKRDSFGLGVLDSVLMGLPDEAAGFSQMLAGNLARAGLPSARVPSQAESEENAVAATNQYRQQAQQAQQDNPWSFGGGQFAGALAQPVGKLKSIPEAALTFGGYGAAHGFGSGDSLDERLKLAGEEGATAAVVGGATKGIFGRAAKAAKPSAMTSKIAAFDQAGVRPTWAAMGPGAATMTNVTGENAIGGVGVRARLRASLEDTQNAARSLAANYGNPAAAELSGARVRAGVSNWEQGFKNRAEVVYSNALGPLKGKPAAAPATEAVLQKIAGESGPPGTQTAEFVIPGVIKELSAGLEADRGKLTFDSLRALRTKIRTMQKANVLQPTIPQANLERIEGALTEDIYANARQIGGPVSLRRLQQADKFYRLGQERIKTALKPFLDETGSDASAYQRIIDFARAGRSQNTRSLIALKQSLKPDEWRDVASSLIDNLGDPTPGAPGAAGVHPFSVNTFVTNYAKLTPEGRAVLFGSRGGGNGPASKLSADLDNLVKVAEMQKRVEGAANHSRSWVNASNGMMALGVYTGIPIPVVGWSLLGNALTGEALTNPAFVRWLARTSQSGFSRASLRQLGYLASRDQALVPLYRQVNDALAPQAPDPGRQQLSAGSRRQ